MTIELKGHLDTSRVYSIKEEIDNKLSRVNANEHVVVDCSELEYISSSGLRIVIGIKKSHPNMEVINVNTEVYSVFEMTGFTRILNIKKALRKINLTECQLIGEGGNGAVYRINDEEIVKVSKRLQGDEELIKENEQVKEAFLMGMPTVISFDTVDCGNGRKGIVMEALDSQSLGAYIAEDLSRMDDIIPKYVSLFKQTNAIETNSSLFHNTKEWLRSHLTLPQRIINDEEAVLMGTILDEIPDCNNFVHFDGHVGNVLMQGAQNDRNLMLIDLGDAGTGHPVLEIAGWAFMMLEPDYAIGCTESDRITGMTFDMRREFCRRLLGEMFQVSDSATLDKLLYQASLIGRVKASFIAQRWADVLKEGKFYDFIIRHTKETITLVSEIRTAVKEFIVRLDSRG